MSGAPYSFSQTFHDEPDMLEGARGLIFNHEYRAAATLLETAPVRSPRVVWWRAFALVLAGDLEPALVLLHDALARSERDVLGVLALAQRFAGQPRTHLEGVTLQACEPLEPFARALLEREVGAYHLEAERFEIALGWLEAAWRTALVGPYGDVQLAGIATPLAGALARLGFDARAVMVLDEAIRRCDRVRRVPLLYERAIRNLHLWRLEACADDLADLEMHVGRGDAEFALLVAYARARHTHAAGANAEARTGFQAVFEGASSGNDPRAAVRELALHSALWLSALHLEADQGVTAETWLEHASGLAHGVRDLAWLTLRRAQSLAHVGGHAEAAEGFASAARGFSSLTARVECAVAHLYRAESLLRLGYTCEDEAGAALLEAALLASEIGGAAPLQLELRRLTRVRAFLEHTLPHVRALLEPGHAYRRVLFTSGGLEGDAGRLPVSASGARLVAYLRDHPCSAWSHVQGAVYGDVPANAVRLAFARDRALVSSVPGLEIAYQPQTHAYSLVWTDVSLDVRHSDVGARATVA